MCLTAIKRHSRWMQLDCKHGLCWDCLLQLVRMSALESSCPLCRAAMFELVGAAQAGPGQPAAAQPAAGAGPQQQPAAANGLPDAV